MALSRDLGNEALRWYLENYRKEQSPEGKPWPSRKSGDSGRALLVKSGGLRRLIRLARITPRSAAIGTIVEYGRYHNTGTNKLPQR